MDGLNGPTNSWLNQFSETENPCMSQTPAEQAALTSNCILWLIAGLIIGGLTFSKKGKA